MVVTFVLAVSVLLQFSAAILALRLTRVTKRRTAWALIATAVFLMAVRRAITLFHLLSGDLTRPPDLAAELVALVTPMLVVAGIAWIAPLFYEDQLSNHSPLSNNAKHTLAVTTHPPAGFDGFSTQKHIPTAMQACEYSKS